MNLFYTFNLGEGITIVLFILFIMLLTMMGVLLYYWMENKWKGWFKQ